MRSHFPHWRADANLLTLQVLKQKRLYESQREQLYNQQFNMDQTAFTLESIKDSVQTVQAMKAANVELKQAFKKGELNIDSIEKLQDEMADMHVRRLVTCCSFGVLVVGSVVQPDGSRHARACLGLVV